MSNLENGLTMNTYIVNKFLVIEIEEWRKELLKKSGDYTSNLRGCSIAWVCYYFNELIYVETVRLMYDFRMEIKNGFYPEELIWHRVAALDAAMLFFDGAYTSADTSLGNLSCEGSGARSIILSSLAIACPVIHSDAYALRKSVERNLETWHMHYDDCLYFCLLAKGDEEEKRDWYYSLKSKFTDQSSVDFFNDFEKNLRLRRCSFFLGTFSQAKSYFLFKILNKDYLAGFENNHFIFDQLTTEELLLKERSHPLSSGYLDFSFLNA
jgi:hypothetical protein